MLFSLTKKTSPYENEIIKKSSRVLIESQRQVYTNARKKFSQRESENIFFIANIFDEVNEPIYIDWIHFSPSGNEIVAGKIYELIKNKL